MKKSEIFTVLDYFLNEETFGLNKYLNILNQITKTNCCKEVEYILQQIINDEKSHILMLKDLVDYYK